MLDIPGTLMPLLGVFMSSSHYLIFSGIGTVPVGRVATGVLKPGMVVNSVPVTVNPAL